MTVPAYPRTEAVEAAEDSYQQAIEQHRDAVQRAQQLRADIQAGAEVDPAALTEATAKIEHAALVIENRHRKMAATRMSARTATLAQLAEEVRGYPLKDVVGALLATTRTVEEGVNAYISQVRRHDAQVKQWRARGTRLDAHGGAFGLPPDHDAGVAVPTGIAAAPTIQVDTLGIGLGQIGETLFRIGIAIQSAASSEKSLDLSQVREFIAHSLIKPLAANVPQSPPRLTVADFRDAEQPAGGQSAPWDLAQR